MSREDVGRALEAMSDESVLEQVGAGDFSALDGYELNDEERAILTDAASDYPETTGFALNAYLANPVAILDSSRSSKFQFALDYATHKPLGGADIAGHQM